MRRPLLVLLPVLLAACGGDDGDASAAPCDLLPPSAARRVAGAGLERMDLATTLQLPSVEDRACVYAPPGTEAGDEPSRVAALQLDEGMPYATQEELLETSGVGAEVLDGVGRGAIIETEEAGYTVVALVDDDRSFALVVRGPDVDREAVVGLAAAIAEKLA